MPTVEPSITDHNTTQKLFSSVKKSFLTYLQDTEKLVAFTLGFVSHQVADVTWHSLGIDQGFLTTMGDVNFFGSFPAAHSIGDPGGDMVVSFEGDTRQIPSDISEW